MYLGRSATHEEIIDCIKSYEKYAKTPQSLVKKILGQERIEEDEEISYIDILVSDLYEFLMEEGEGEILFNVPSKEVKHVIKMVLNGEELKHDDNVLSDWVSKNNKKIVNLLIARKKDKDDYDFIKSKHGNRLDKIAQELNAK